ncbi:L-histidine N(alpha)-methyltransferase [Christiangramia sabulilitoris]|uniref:L-histidine N(Alpha)-methyltransferase n=1 Tax=Christiangramia sabulilitoris TaxID=2583991 RepID=A0A550HZI8_9FLAO|nr:L-histidine N(alpha)-methyltransferase [Christiangramia sabulilitoris]TRO64131.1 L-histidine N(alpha)-methyltransferase [Christiangramia sabulilitoris]
MKNTPEIMFESAFAEDTFKGLSSFPKYLLSKYIYDKKGDKLFQKIMDMPEYYLTSCEFDILQQNAENIITSFYDARGIDLIELGAGDGKKTKILLRQLVETKADFKYLPIDISQNVLDELKDSLATEIPEVNVEVQQGTYFKTLERLAEYNTRKKVILVLGSNIGNLNHEEAVDFLRNIAHAMREEDMLFMGFDQKKHPQKILDAYNDPAGITEEFNKNLLVRINEELGGNFNTENFMHWETYNPETGTAKSFLVSNKKQQVEIKNLDLNLEFAAWETIHTEISQKYDDAVVEWLADESGLSVDKSFGDKENCYKNYIFRRK